MGLLFVLVHLIVLEFRHSADDGLPLIDALQLIMIAASSRSFLMSTFFIDKSCSIISSRISCSIPLGNH